MVEYKRGEIFDVEQDRARKLSKVVERGEAIEELVNSKGWRYITEFLQTLINNHKKNIESLILQRVEIDKLTDVTITVKAYEFLLNLPQEFIRKKDEVLKSKGVK